MPAYKDSKTGTWFVKFYCKDWTGENKQIKKWNAISIHKQPHTNNRIWTVLFAFSIVLQTVFFLNLKVIIRTVIVKYLLISWMDEV